MIDAWIVSAAVVAAFLFGVWYGGRSKKRRPVHAFRHARFWV